MPAAGWTKMSEKEVALAKTWYDGGEACSEIAEKLGRDKSAITRLLIKQVDRKKQGRPELLTPANVSFLRRKLNELVKKANCQYTVTVAMLKKACRLKASERSIAQALHNEGIYFRKLREKPVLTAVGMKSRLEFARKYCHKPTSWWSNTLDAAIDCNFFKALLNNDARVRAAQKATHGAYRAVGEGLDAGYVKPQGALNYNTGAKSVLIAGGVKAAYFFGIKWQIHAGMGRLLPRCTRLLCSKTCSRTAPAKDAFAFWRTMTRLDSNQSEAWPQRKQRS